MRSKAKYPFFTSPPLSQPSPRRHRAPAQDVGKAPEEDKETEKEKDTDKKEEQEKDTNKKESAADIAKRPFSDWFVKLFTQSMLVASAE